MPRASQLIVTALLSATALTGMATAADDRRDRSIAISLDARLHFIEAGPSSAQAIVLIPGWCFGADVWSAQIADLSDSYHVIAIDPRSQGTSSIVVNGNSPDARAGDIDVLMRRLQLRKPVLVGWSQGVQDVAAYVMAHGTENLAGLILVDAPVSGGSAALDGRAAAETMARMALYVRDPRAYLEGMMPYVFRRPLVDRERGQLVAQALRTPTSIGVSNLVLDLYAKDYRPALALIKIPTLVMVAGTAPDRRLQLDQPIAGQTQVVIEEAGHAVFHDEPEQFNRQVREFLKLRVAPLQ
jgi:non-heme chloroperoxidase